MAKGTDQFARHLALKEQLQHEVGPQSEGLIKCEKLVNDVVQMVSKDCDPDLIPVVSIADSKEIDSWLLSSELGEPIPRILTEHESKSLGQFTFDRKKLDRDQLIKFWLAVGSAPIFRERKINEFVAYRYARSCDLDIDLETFLKNTHEITDKGRGYQKRATPEDEGSVRRLLSKNLNTETIDSIMAHFARLVDQEPTSLSLKKAFDLALVYFLLFQIIHPFPGANGRVGRSLFIFLQRKFQGEKLAKTYHLPISRQETGTHQAQSTKSQFSQNHLGSLSLDLSELIHRVGSSPLVEQLRSDINAEETGQAAMITIIDEIKERLQSGFSEEIAAMTTAIKQQGAQDSLDSQDFNFIKQATIKIISSPNDNS